MVAPLGSVDYGPVNFRLDRIIEWKFSPNYTHDDSDRLYTHVRVSVECWWNPQATSSLGANPAVRSIADLYQEMTRPRRPLKITIAGVVALISPSPKAKQKNPAKLDYYNADARTGPLPISFDVIEVIGDKTAKCRFSVECWIPLVCERDFSQGKKLSSVLSNRWEMSEAQDLQYLATRTVDGTAIFRTDALLENKQLVDDFRAACSFPIPPGYQRESVNVSVSPDGTTLKYRWTDKEGPGVNLLGGISGAIVKLRGTWRYGWTAPRGKLIDLDSMNANCVRRMGVTVQAWGRRTTTRQQLIEAVIFGVQAYGFDDFRSPHLWEQMDLNVDLWDKFAQLDAGVMVDSAVANLAALLGDAPAERRPTFGPDGVITGPGEDKEPIIRKLSGGGRRALDSLSTAHDFINKKKFPDDIAGLTTTKPVPNPRPLGGNGTREGLEWLFAQVLLDQCQLPPLAPSVRNRVSLTQF